MPLRLRTLVATALALGGAVWAGAAMAQSETGPPAGGELSGYEIVRANFLASDDRAEGTARCSPGKMVLGGGARVIDEDQTRYLLTASEPAGPSGWTAVFVRAPEPPAPEPESGPDPLLPDPTGPDEFGPGEPGPDEPDPDEGTEAEESETHFEVSAVCATLR